MGGYRTEDEALIALARQLSDAYGEARRREDQDFACDAIAEFLSEYGRSAPHEALLALLDLPLTAETYPLVDEAQTALADRGAAVVELLLEATLGEVYNPDGTAPERAAETLDMMDRREVVRGLAEALCGRADDDVKGAALDRLVALGPFAEPTLAGALDDPRGGDWVRAALSQIRSEAGRLEALEEYAAGEGVVPDDARGLLSADVGRREDHSVGAGLAGEASSRNAVAGEAPGASAGAPPDADAAVGPAGSGAPTGPDQHAPDDPHDESLRRQAREPEDGASAS
jgi:hypothetical protein